MINIDTIIVSSIIYNQQLRQIATNSSCCHLLQHLFLSSPSLSVVIFLVEVTSFSTLTMGDMFITLVFIMVDEEEGINLEDTMRSCSEYGPRKKGGDYGNEEENWSTKE